MVAFFVVVIVVLFLWVDFIGGGEGGRREGVTDRIMETCNNLYWKRPKRIIEPNSWLCTRPYRI